MVKTGNFGELLNYKFFDEKYSELLDNDRFIVCLTHDVDNVRKRHQYITRFIRTPGLSQLRSLAGEKDPYWNFDKICDIEQKHGVKSTFFFLCQSSQSNVFSTLLDNKRSERYNVQSKNIKEKIIDLDTRGWEIGLHASFDSYRDYNLLKHEKEVLEGILDHKVLGVRQHYLNLSIPKTWLLQRKCGFIYDSSFGHNKRVGFKNNIYYPFTISPKDFVIIPVTIMDAALFTYYNSSKIWEYCKSLIEKSAKKKAILNILWHQESFSELDFPFYSEIYNRIIELSIKKGARFSTLGEVSKSLLS